MFKINAVIKSSFKLSVVLALSLTGLISFGESVDSYETVRLTPMSVEERIKLTNAQVQQDSEITESVKDLFNRYTETLIKCSPPEGFYVLGTEALVNIFLGIRVYEIAYGSDFEELFQVDVWNLMDSIESNLSQIRCVDANNSHREALETALSVQGKGRFTSRIALIEEISELAKFLNTDTVFAKVEGDFY